MSLRASKYSNCLYYSTNALSRILTKMAEEEFTVTGLSPSYAFLLMTVNEKPGIQPSEISREMQLSPSTVTRLVEKMEYRGYLQRRSEGRATYVEPTSRSLELDGKIREAWQNLSERYSDVLGDRYSEVLTEMTYKAVEELD
ncbi:MAG: MarR family transcriptional regulator [Balneolaceae bacterium]|nr:MarR family transcriptional regulator [Balneolaceae bacterium]